MRQKIIYSILSTILLTLSFLTGRLSTKLEAQENPTPITVIEDLAAPGTLEDTLELIKQDHSKPCPECVCELTICPNTDSLAKTQLLTGPFVASQKSSSKKFHTSDSATGKRIKPENRIYFTSKEEAIAAGYLPGSGVT